MKAMSILDLYYHAATDAQLLPRQLQERLRPLRNHFGASITSHPDDYDELQDRRRHGLRLRLQEQKQIRSIQTHHLKLEKPELDVEGIDTHTVLIYHKAKKSVKPHFRLPLHLADCIDRAATDSRKRTVESYRNPDLAIIDFVLLLVAHILRHACFETERHSTKFLPRHKRSWF